MRAATGAAVALLLAAAPACANISLTPTPLAWDMTYAPGFTSMDYNYGQALGMSLLFFEAQRSGRIDSMPDGGNRIPWRGDQLLDDGSDVGVDLEGGYYEAGNRLKITLPTSYSLSRIAWSCLYFHDTWRKITFQGQSMLYWCKRELKWGAYWLLKAYVPGNARGERTGTWGDDDALVLMVGTIQDEWGGDQPGDFDCYKRAENLPAMPNCPASARQTLLADSSKPASDTAASTSAALIATAALLATDYPVFAEYAVNTSHALYDFAVQYPESAKEREFLVNRTYPTTDPALNRIWASSMLAWVHRECSGDWPLCDASFAEQALANAEREWTSPIVQRKLQDPVSFWDNSLHDSALLLDLMSGSADNEYRAINTDFVQQYVDAEGGDIRASPKGLRIYRDNEYANLRVATYSSYHAAFYATLPGVPAPMLQAARCLARSQMGYVVGDTGRSFVVGFGESPPTHIHHRDSACTLQEDAAGECDRKSKDDRTYAFATSRPNPHELTGAIVGGPDSSDVFVDDRERYEFTEVALDYNAGLTLGLAGVASFPASFWASDCSKAVPNYPWNEAGKFYQN